MSHMLNGVPVTSVEPKTVLVQAETFYAMGTEITAVRGALRETLAYIDLLTSGQKSSWSQEDTRQRAKWNALAVQP